MSWYRPIRIAIIWLFVGFLLAGFFYYYLSYRVNLVRYDHGVLKTSDLIYHLLIVRAFWFDGVDTVYQLGSQLEILSAFVGQKMDSAMPLGVTPLAFLVWAPFSCLVKSHPAVVSSVWMALSLCVFCGAMLKVLAEIHSGSRLAGRLSLYVFVCGLLSVTTVSALLLGQTSILAAGAFLLLVLHLAESERGGGVGHTGLIVFLLFLLAMKPPYLALGGAVLLLYGRVRELFMAAGLLLLALALLTLKLGLSWPSDYAGQLHLYISGQIPEAYASSIVIERMNTFTRAAGHLLGEQAVFSVSNVIWLGGFALCLIGGVLRRYASAVRRGGRFAHLGELRLSVLLVALYLLFSPYLGVYEDVFLLSMLGVALYSRKEESLARWQYVAFALLLIVLLNHTLLITPIFSLIFWLLKFSFVCLVYHACCPERSAST